VLNLGAGVQSTTLYLMNLQGLFQPRFDCAIFADTQEEPEEVYHHLQWLQQHPIPVLVGTFGKLGDDLIHGKATTVGTRRWASIPAFVVSQDGKIGRIKRQCTATYKIDVVENVLRQEVLKLPAGKHIRGTRTKIHQYYGISVDEKSRASRIYENNLDKPWSEAHFPLLDLGMTRTDCVQWLSTQNIPHTVPRSACTFCPFHTNAEWLRIKTEDSAAWNRSVQIDRALRETTTQCNQGLYGEMYLHSSCKPLEEVEFTKKGPEVSFESECTGMCGN